MFYHRHSDWSTRMQIWSANNYSAAPCPPFSKTSVPGLLHCVEFDENAVPNQWSRIQTIRYLYTWSLTKVMSQNTYKNTCALTMPKPSKPFSTKKSKKHWWHHSLRWCLLLPGFGLCKISKNATTRPHQSVFKKGGNFFGKVRDMCWWKQKDTWMTGWCKDFEELEWFSDYIISYGTNQVLKCQNVTMFLSKYLSTNHQPAYILYTKL